MFSAWLTASAMVCSGALVCFSARWKFPLEEHLHINIWGKPWHSLLRLFPTAVEFSAPTKPSFLSAGYTSTWCSHLRLTANQLSVTAAWSRSFSLRFSGPLCWDAGWPSPNSCFCLGETSTFSPLLAADGCLKATPVVLAEGILCAGNRWERTEQPPKKASEQQRI